MNSDVEGRAHGVALTKGKFPRFFLPLGAGFLIVFVSIYGFSLLRLRPGLPQGIDKREIIQVDHDIVKSPDDLEFIFGQKAIGDPTTFTLKRNGQTERLEAQMAAAFGPGPFQLLYYLLVGTFCLILGFAVFVLRPEDPQARIFYWASLTFSSIVLISGGYNGVRTGWLSYLPGSLYYFLYPLAPAALFHFSLSFSPGRFRAGKLFFYATALIFSGVMTSLFLYSNLKMSFAAFRLNSLTFSIFRLFVLGLVVLTILHLAIRLRRAGLDEDKARIKWVFFGLFLGLFPFMFLYSLPRTLKISSLLSEQFSSLFFIFIPIAFAISILKFKLMDIELVINRSLVYSILSVLTVSIYLLTVQIFNNFFARFLSAQKAVVSVAGVLLAAAVFHPARKRIQTFVDRAFYRQSYDYRKCILSFNEKAQKIFNQENLIDFFLLKLKSALPLEHLGIFIYQTAAEESRLLFKRSDREEGDPVDILNRHSDKIMAKKKSTRTVENVDFSRERLLEEKKWEMVLPLSFESASVRGFLTLGKKKSGERFSAEDLELLRTMAGEFILNLDRIRLQEEVVHERASREKLDELNRLKTEFISTVSHELRTPMSSIQGITEILESGKVRNTGKREALLHLMAGETGRLSRLLHNILDFGKIEQQTKQYHFQKTAIQPLLGEVVDLFTPRLQAEGFALRTKLPEEPLILDIDPDAIKQALINLIDNAIKYSTQEKEIEIQVVDGVTTVEIQVKDRGIGVALEDQEKIFEKFYRTGEAAQHNPKGVGLGLKIVKHIMEAHLGKITISSEPNKGSTFALVFPK